MAEAQLTPPSFTSEATVHDPSVIRVDERYYVFGSHLAAAWSDDLMNWTQISTDAGAGNTLIPNVTVEMREALQWASTNTFWAPDVFQLPDGRFYLYYCASRMDAPRASLGLAVSDSVEGPYEDVGIMLQSGMWGQPSEDGTIYDATVHPNTVDPCVFYDAEGTLWMVYGSYSGGIFILQLDPETGFPLPDQGYGKKLIGGNHSRIEAPYILYHPETEYYYLFLSFGGLAADGGYNVRVARSTSPDGPYYDAAGNEMTDVAGAPGTLFDDASIAPYGVKLMGNWKFASAPGEPSSTSQGYVSPGHNSAYYDPESGEAYLVFHTRFEGRGEIHNVRTHQLYFNEDDWPVVAPHRYAEEVLGRYQPELMLGGFKVVEHGKEISATIKVSQLIELEEDGSVTGYRSGSWELLDGRDLRIELDGEEYRGVASHQWDGDNATWVMAFSALSQAGEAVWGSQVASEHSLIEQWRVKRFGHAENSGSAADSVDADGDSRSNLIEYALGSDPGRSDGSGLLVGQDPTGELQLRFGRVFDPDLVYIVESSDGLSGGAWTEVWRGRGTEARPALVPVAEQGSSFAEESRFWRLRLERSEP